MSFGFALGLHLVGGAVAGDPVPSVTVSDDNIIIIDNFDGTATITITAPSIYAGEYIVDTSGLPGSPVEVVPVAIAGDDYLVGSTLIITPAIWLYEGDLVSITHDVYAGETLIGSDVGASFTIPDGALGATITVQENIVTSLSFGLNMSVSTPTVEVAPTPPTDDFERADGALGSNWPVNNTFGGDLEIISGQVSAGATPGGLRGWIDAQPANHYAQVTMGSGVTGSSSAGVVARYAGINQYYAIEMLPSTVRLVLRNGGLTVLDTHAHTVTTGDVVRLEVDAAGALRGYINGALVMSATDATLSGTYAGVFLYRSGTSALIEDFTAGAL